MRGRVAPDRSGPCAAQLLFREVQRGFRLAVRRRAEQAHALAQLHVVAARIAEMEVVGHGEDGEVKAHAADEVCLRSKGECPRIGMEPVSADHEVEPAWPSRGKIDLHALRRFLKRPDRIAEAVLRLPARGRVQHPGQFSAQYLDVAAREAVRKPRHDSSALVDHGDLPGACFVPLDGLGQPHAVEHARRRAAKVDRVPAGTERGGALDHRDLKAVTSEPERQRRAGDARAGDEDSLGHGRAPFKGEPTQDQHSCPDLLTVPKRMQQHRC